MSPILCRPVSFLFVLSVGSGVADGCSHRVLHQHLAVNQAYLQIKHNKSLDRFTIAILKTRASEHPFARCNERNPKKGIKLHTKYP